MFKSRGLILVPAILLAVDLMAQANPMQPPAFALFKYQQEKLRKNPNRDVAALNAGKIKPFVLNSIIYSKSRKIAVINEQLLRVGDKVNGAKLVSINKDSIRLIKQGKSIRLQLDGGVARPGVTTTKSSL